MARRRGKRSDRPGWEVYRKPEAARPEDHAAAGDPLPPPTPPSPAPAAPSSPAATPVRWWRLERRLLLVAVAVAVMVAAGALVALATRGGGKKAPQAHDVAFEPFMTQRQLDGLVKAVVARTGSSRVLMFGWYFGEAQVETPPAKGKDLAHMLSYDGHRLSQFDLDAVKKYQKPFDLRSLDVDALAKVYRAAWDGCPGVRRADSLDVEAPASTSDRWVWAYVDEADHSFYSVTADLDGTIVEREQVGSG